MDKGLKIFLGFLAFLLIAGIIVQSSLPKPINRTATYRLEDKIPLGMYVLSQELDSLFKNSETEIWPNTFFEYFSFYHIEETKDTLLDKARVSATDTQSNQIYPTTNFYPDRDSFYGDMSLFFINQYFECDVESAKAMLQFIRKGNTALISALAFPDYLMDSLGIYTIRPGKFSDFENIIPVTQDSLPTIGGNWPYSGVYFDTDSLTNFEILGYTCDDEGNWKPNFVKINVGKGNLYLHAEPAVFSNFSLLDGENFRQAEFILSRIHSDYILWLAKDQTGGPVSGSVLRYVKSQPPLRLAWYLLLVGFLLLMIFNAKRWQRPIPIVPPNTNTSEEFVKTISNLYQQEGSVRDIMDKKIIFFLEKIRSRYLIPTEKLDHHFIQRLHLKTLCSLKDAERVVFLIQKHRDSDYTCTHDDLRRLNKAMEAVG